MLRDKNADKRFEYNQKIAAKEHERDELHLEEHQAQNRIESFESVMMNGFRQFQEIEETLNRGDTRLWDYDETAQKQQYVSRIILKQQEGLNQVYQKSKLKLGDECEQFQKERDNLAWD